MGWRFSKVRGRRVASWSDNARDVMIAAAAYYSEHGTHATLRQIMADTGIVSTNTARRNLIALSEAGYVDRIQRNTATVYVPTEAGLSAARRWQNGED